MKAAQIVAADGRNPTVDSVREALGSTGSKSTIAPLLKRWKEEFQGVGAVKTESGLPAELMEAMRGVYDKQQRDVAQQLETGMRENRAELDAALAQLKKTETERLKLTEARAALTQELRATQHALAQLKEEHHFRAVTLATLHSDNAGLTQRLADRGEEIAALNRQLAQVRSQFEHYQEAAATQRSEERAQAQQRISRLEQDNAQLQQRLQGQQATLVQQDMRLAQLQAKQTTLAAQAAADREALATVRPERDQFEFQYLQAATSADALLAKLDTALLALNDAKVALAAQDRQLDMLAENGQLSQQKMEALAQERDGLLRDNAGMAARLGLLMDSKRKRDV
ncbi:DNA-binding protein [Janthinobacterium sp. SUN026]|uniref:DNA-binding protein n=1 Tax=Janthinobacterium sp. SUN026 TaxID=3002438 RepID=UPI0025B249DC|nr:DNA-binding protein [Janthinobacterium sp. SUN026]MDN2671893.1 DNA-binding protein [Janthinobacterium sp. SUN026]